MGRKNGFRENRNLQNSCGCPGGPMLPSHCQTRVLMASEISRRRKAGEEKWAAIKAQNYARLNRCHELQQGRLITVGAI